MAPVLIAFLMLQAEPAPLVVPSPAVNPLPAPRALEANPPATPTTPTQGPAVVSTEPQTELEPAPRVRPFEMPAVAPSAPAPYAPVTPDLPAPVKVEDYRRSYEGPKDAIEAYYDTGVLAAFEAEQALHGAMDGDWTVSSAGGAPLFSLLLTDSGRPEEPLAGAWRDLAPGPSTNASGVIDQVGRDGDALVVRIRVRDDAAPVTLRLMPAAAGRWRGELRDAAGARPVVMDRKAP